MARPLLYLCGLTFIREVICSAYRAGIACVGYKHVWRMAVRLYAWSGTIALALVLVLMTVPSAPRTALAQTATPPSGCENPLAPGYDTILGHVNAPTGTVMIPELNLTTSITNGCFAFKNVALPQEPVLISFQITADGFRPTTWAHYVVISVASGGPMLTFTLDAGTEPKIIDPCPELIAHPPTYSAAIEGQTELCAQLQGSSLPSTGTGQRIPSTPVSALPLLAFAGLTALTAGAALSVRRR